MNLPKQVTQLPAGSFAVLLLPKVPKGNEKHSLNSLTYKTLKQVQGDRKVNVMLNLFQHLLMNVLNIIEADSSLRSE